MRIFSKTCSHCGGALTLEWFKHQKRIFFEAVCINCARTLTPFEIRKRAEELRHEGRKRIARRLEDTLDFLMKQFEHSVED
jgi:hypothetical protein